MPSRACQWHGMMAGMAVDIKSSVCITQDAFTTQRRLEAELQDKDIPHQFIRVSPDYYE